MLSTIFLNSEASSQKDSLYDNTSSSGQDISYPINKEAVYNLAGASTVHTYGGKLSCKNLLEKTWAYPNAEILSLCYDAERACLRHQLLIRELKKGHSVDTRSLEKSRIFSESEALEKLTTCILGLEYSTVKGSNLQLPQFGGAKSPFQKLTPPN